MTALPHDESADLHTPEELLAGAESLLVERDEQLMRAAVLEAITALEAYVHRTVFGVLHRTIDPALADCLDKKTRMDFDTRLSILVPAATGIAVDQTSSLWQRYKAAKTIRNRVTHGGSRVTREEARTVVETVKEWLSVIGSTADVDLSLLGLKKYVERRKIPVPDEASAVHLVERYFAKTRAAAAEHELAVAPQSRVDLVLRFGSRRVLVEVKYLRDGVTELDKQIDRAVATAKKHAQPTGDARTAVVVFSDTELPRRFRDVERRADGAVSVVVIRLRA